MIQKVITLAFLAILLIVTFMSDKIATLFVKENEDEQKKTSLYIKGIALAITVIFFFLFFI